MNIKSFFKTSAMITTMHFPKLFNSLKCNEAFSNFLMNSYLQHRSHYRSNVGHSQTHQTITQGCGADEKKTKKPKQNK